MAHSLSSRTNLFQHGRSTPFSVCRSIAYCGWIGSEIGVFDFVVFMFAVPIFPPMNQMKTYAKLTSSKDTQRYEDLTNEILKFWGRRRKTLKQVDLTRKYLWTHYIREFKIWRRQRQRKCHKSMIWLVEWRKTRPCARVNLCPGGFCCCIKLDGLSNLKYCWNLLGK